MRISKNSNRNHHVSSNNSTNNYGEVGYNITIEIDSHDYTHCFGRKFRILSQTEQVWSVTAFLDKLSATNYVAIVTDTTAIIDNDGAVFISVFVQGLDFTNKMDKILINPNQCISFSAQLILEP